MVGGVAVYGDRGVADLDVCVVEACGRQECKEPYDNAVFNRDVVAFHERPTKRTYVVVVHPARLLSFGLFLEESLLFEVVA